MAKFVCSAVTDTFRTASYEIVLYVSLIKPSVLSRPRSYIKRAMKCAVYT